MNAEGMSAPDLSQGVGFADGRYCPRGEMQVSTQDLGFIMSDLAYDAAHVWKGRFFRLEDHLDRWDRSISRRQYSSLPYNREQVRDILMECVRRLGLREALAVWVATRGIPSTEGLDLRACKNNFMAWVIPFVWKVPREKLERGEGANIYVSSVLRIPPESTDPTVKNYARLDFSRALLEAYEHGSEYPVLVDRDGNVTEGPGWNLFALYGGTLVSPERGVLEGITRRTVLELCSKTNVKGQLGRIKADELEQADEVFLASTAGGIMPVTRVNDIKIKNEVVGPVTIRLRDMYWALHDDPAYTTPVNYGPTLERA